MKMLKRTEPVSKRRPSVGLLACLACVAAASCAGSPPSASNSAADAGAAGRGVDVSGADGGGAGPSGAGMSNGGLGTGKGGMSPASGGSNLAEGGVTDYTAGLPPLGGAAGKAPFDWAGVIGTGQSLSVGWEGDALSATQVFGNLKLQDDGADPKYPLTDAATANWSVVPLTEPIRKTVSGNTDNQYPNNIWHAGDIYGETPHSGMANMISSVWGRRNGASYVSAHSVVGVAGVGIAQLSKGTNSYAAAINETQIFKRLATAAGKTYGVSAIILTHGEADAANAAYGGAVWQLYQDYNADLRKVTGQTGDVVMIASQQSSASLVGAGGSAVQIWQLGVDHPGRIVCAGPKYQYGPYGLHMSGPSYLRLGEKYGEIFDLIVNQGQAWKPVSPNKVTRAGAVLTIDFDVPTAPLTWDSRLTAPHQQAHTPWSKGRGFEVSDSSGKELEIESVQIQNTSVVLTLAQTPAAGVLTLAYAITQDTTDGNQGGTDAGAHGQLRDSDEMIGPDFEKIEVSVTNGSTAIKAAQGGFVRRAPRDVVTGPGLAHDTVATKLEYENMVLSSPWPGDTGKATLTFNHDLHNYCVHFSIPVP